MEKTIYIDNKPVRLKSTAALPKRYKAQFRRDYFADLFKIAKVFEGKNKKEMDLKHISYEDLSCLDLDVLYDIIWTLAKTADKSIPEPLEWYDQFERFDLMKVLPMVGGLISGSVSQSKKKVNDKDSSSDELFTAESFSLVCKQAGLTSEDMEDMTIGDCLDYVQEYIDSHRKGTDGRTNVRRASQSDFDNF